MTARTWGSSCLRNDTWNTGFRRREERNEYRPKQWRAGRATEEECREPFLSLHEPRDVAEVLVDIICNEKFVFTHCRPEWEVGSRGMSVAGHFLRAEATAHRVIRDPFVTASLKLEEFVHQRLARYYVSTLEFFVQAS